MDTEEVKSQDEKAIENVEKTRAEAYLDPETKKFKEGNPGGGRPKGSVSIKERVRQYLIDHPDKLDEIVKHFVNDNRELMWQMLEGRPNQQTDLTSGGESLQPLLVKFLDGEESNNSGDSERV